jgi:drug/metabolite transporter (DMT)-like permease
MERTTAPTTTESPPVSPRAWTLLVFGVVVASFSAIFVRYAEDAEPLAISFWRCAAGALLIAPFAVRGLRRMDGQTFKVCLVSGAFLAFHFATWLTSLELTTVASSVLLVSTTPVFVALAARPVFGERLSRYGWLGILIALAGTGLVSGTDLGESSVGGDLLAILGAVGAAGYVMAGREARLKVGVLEYAVVTYGVAAFLLLPICLVAGSPLSGYDASTWWALAAIIVGPQLFGHTVINQTLSDIDATTVSVTVMAEPIIATVAAWVLFEEVPSWQIYPGGAAILLGIYMVTTANRQPAVIST